MRGRTVVGGSRAAAASTVVWELNNHFPDDEDPSVDQELQDELRTQLEQERDREEARLEETSPVRDGKELHNVETGETGTAQAAENTRQRSEKLGTIDHTESRLGKIEHALERMDEGKYGTCEVCGTDIDAERLRAYPLATRCIEHAEETASATA